MNFRESESFPLFLEQQNLSSVSPNVSIYIQVITQVMLTANEVGFRPFAPFAMVSGKTAELIS
jgi:hypothetical protein